MTTPTFEQRNLACVALGMFSPAMFHPTWFAHYDLLGEKEVASATGSEKLLVTDELTLFNVSGFAFEVRSERLQIQCLEENLFEATRDLFCSVLQILDASIVKQLGLNWGVHYSLPNTKAWHAAGDKLVPKTFWKSIWPKDVGMRNLTLELERDDDIPGLMNVILQPSRTLDNGVYMVVNDHFEIASPKDQTAHFAADLIQENFVKSQATAHRLMNAVYEETSVA